MIKRFLVVDDDIPFAELVAAKLAPYGKCTLAHGGADAAMQFTHYLEESTPFDVVFMDIVMPEMDGHDVIRQLREIEQKHGVNPGRGFKLVMLTAHSDIDNVTKSFFTGNADSYLPKDKLHESFETALRDVGIA